MPPMGLTVQHRRQYVELREFKSLEVGLHLSCSLYSEGTQEGAVRYIVEPPDILKFKKLFNAGLMSSADVVESTDSGTPNWEGGWHCLWTGEGYKGKLADLCSSFSRSFPLHWSQSWLATQDRGHQIRDVLPGVHAVQFTCLNNGK